MSRVNWKNYETEEENSSSVDTNNRVKVQEKVCINFRDNTDDTSSEVGSTINASSISTTRSNYERCDFCNRCQEIIEELKEEKRQLGAQLIEQGYHVAKFNNMCRCKLKEDLEIIQREERCLLETIELKKERLENLKQSDSKLTSDIKTAKDNVIDKMVTYKEICNCLESTEQSYNIKSQDIKNKQNINIELEKNIKKLQTDAKELVKQIRIHQQTVDDKKKIYEEILNISHNTDTKIKEQKKMLMNFDTVATEFQARIKHLKGEMKMLAESQHFHQQEVAMRTEQLAKISQEKQKYNKLVEKAQSDLQSVQQILKTQEELKSANDKNYIDLKGETQKLGELLEKEKKDKIILIQKLNSSKEIIKNAEFDLKTVEENYNRIRIIIEDLKNKRYNAKEELLKLVNEDKQKIKILLEECSQYEHMLKDCMLIKNLIKRDNDILESSLVDKKIDVHAMQDLKIIFQEDVTADELEARLAKHHKTIEVIRGRFGDIENRFDTLKKDQEQYEWCSPITKYESKHSHLEREDNESQTSLKEVTCIDIKYECSGCDNGFCCTEIHKKLTNK